MPVQSVAAATPDGTLNGAGGTFAVMGFRSYREELEYPTRANVYQNGWLQQKNLANNYRRRFICSVRMTAANAATFKTFYDARGKTVPFLFRPLREAGTPKTVRFDSGWSQTVALHDRVDIDFVLVEVA